VPAPIKTEKIKGYFGFLKTSPESYFQTTSFCSAELELIFALVTG
jgi:hypothetical protein